MSRILFVDDEQNVLDALRRMLHAHHGEWDMTFALGGREAIRLLAGGAYDILVTDLRMPELNGIELLQHTIEHRPELIRVVLSGAADLDLTLQAVSLSHQYLLKPCDTQTLRTTIRRATCLAGMLNHPGLRNLITRVQSLPSMPLVYSQLVQLLHSNDASPQMVGKLVARDIGMTAKVLQLVNSPFFGTVRPMSNPVDAVIYLGIEMVRALVLTASVFSRFTVTHGCGFSMDELQQHSLAVGSLARRIAQSMNLSPADVESAFVGGLLHDTGKLVLASAVPAEYATVLDRARREGIPLSQAEQEVFGTGHAEIGAYLLWLWGLPDPVTEILALHHRPPCAPDVSLPLLAVHSADALVNEDSACGLNLESLEAAGFEESLPTWRDMRLELSEAVAC